MEHIPKVYIGLFLIFINVFLAVGVVSANINTSKATTFHADCIDEIENSNFSPTVIEKCKESASDIGYTLTVTVYKNSRNEPEMAEVVLDYKYAIPFLNINTTHEKRGFAR